MSTATLLTQPPSERRRQAHRRSDLGASFFGFTDQNLIGSSEFIAGNNYAAWSSARLRVYDPPTAGPPSPSR